MGQGNTWIKPLRGVVWSNKMMKSVTVMVERMYKHPKYGKYVRGRKKYMAHDEHNACGMNDLVEIKNAGRKLSKHKRWVVTRILRKEPTYDHDNLGKDSQILLDVNEARRLRFGGVSPAVAMEREAEAATEATATTDPEVAAGESGASSGGVGAEKEEESVVEEREVPSLGSGPQVIGVPSKPKYASFRGFASGVWGF